MNRREYIQANKDWLAAKAKEEGVKALPKSILYKVLSRKERWRSPLATQHSDGALYRKDHRRQAVRQQPGRSAARHPSVRPHRGLDNRHATDVRGRQVGSLYPCRDGLRQVLAARHPWRFHTDIRNRVDRHSVGNRWLINLQYELIWKI